MPVNSVNECDQNLRLIYYSWRFVFSCRTRNFTTKKKVFIFYLFNFIGSSFVRLETHRLPSLELNIKSKTQTDPGPADIKLAS